MAKTRANPKAKTTAKKAGKTSATAPTPQLDENERKIMIATAAYFLAEQRGFIEGDELSDWLLAESEIQASLQQQ